MPKINLLPKNVAELIAAGEVVERPASVIKELVENSIDAGSKVITVEIQRGGITYIRITDNGCGIEMEDVPTAFLRHATSKIKTDLDLDSIATLGFRGEALAAVSSVSKVEMLTKTAQSNIGAHYVIEGGEEKLFEESGCPTGTTIIIRDIFYNTPARMKFLKKDVSEANACAAVVERIALSHPEISFKFIRDGKVTLSTAGDGILKNCIYSVLGREFSNSLIEVNNELGGVSVTGLTCKPVFCKATRNSQYTFLNGRLVRSGTVIAAVEQAYKNSAMVGKFPAFVLYVTIPFDTVDVNVHPAKTEVRFSDEKRIFDAVYAALKNAITLSDTRPEVKLNTPVFNRFEHMTAAEYRQQKIGEENGKTIAEEIYKTKPKEKDYSSLRFNSNANVSFVNRYSTVGQNGEKVEYKENKEITVPEIKVEEKPSVTERDKETTIPFVREKTTVKTDIDIMVEDDIPETPEIILIGEAFSTYIVVQMKDSIFMIDKHAAHERILYNKLVSEQKVEVQALLTPVSVMLNTEEYDGIINNLSLLKENGFEIEDFGNSAVIVRAVPVFLIGSDITSILSEIAEGLLSTGKVITERKEHIMHTVACKAAIKAGGITSKTEMLDLAKKVLLSKDVMYCPHGRPVAFEIKKRELEKQFGRIQ